MAILIIALFSSVFPPFSFFVFFSVKKKKKKPVSLLRLSSVWLISNPPIPGQDSSKTLVGKELCTGFRFIEAPTKAYYSLWKKKCQKGIELPTDNPRCLCVNKSISVQPRVLLQGDLTDSSATITALVRCLQWAVLQCGYSCPWPFPRSLAPPYPHHYRALSWTLERMLHACCTLEYHHPCCIWNDPRFSDLKASKYHSHITP